MGKKLLVSLAMEGKFASDGLQAIDEGDDILMAMARELVTEKGIGESADLVWKQLQRQQAEAFGVRAAETSPSEIEPSAETVPEVIIPPEAPIPAVVTQLLMFGMSHEAVQRRKSSRRPSIAATVSDQLASHCSTIEGEVSRRSDQISVSRETAVKVLEVSLERGPVLGVGILGNVQAGHIRGPRLHRTLKTWLAPALRRGQGYLMDRPES